MKKIMHKITEAVLTLAILIGIVPNISVSAAVDEFSGIEFYTLEMRDCETAEAGTSGFASTMGVTVWNDYLVVPAYFGNPIDENDRNKIFVYDLSEGTPEYLTEYNMVDLGLAQRTGDYASQDIISGLSITEDYMIVTYYIKTGWPNYYTKDMVYIYENPLTGVSPRETLTRVKINDTDIYSGTVSTFITDGQYLNLYNDGAVNLHTIGNYLISFAQEHAITESRNFYITDISGETLSVSTISEYETFVTSEGTASTRLLDVVFDGVYAYVLTALEGATEDDATTNLALFAVDFSDPQNPEVLGDCTFDSNYLYSDISNLGGYVTIEDGYAYVSTCGINNKGVQSNVDKKVHLFTLKKAGSSFEFIKEFVLDTTMTISGGFGAVGVVDDIAVCLNGPTVKNSMTYLQFNETKDEIISYQKGGNINTDASANCNSVVSYGSRLFFGLLRTGVTGATDANKAVVDVFDVLNKGIEWHDAENIANQSYDNIYAEFENPYIVDGVNTVYVSGTNTGAETGMQLILALYDEAGNLVTTSAGEKVTVPEGAEIDISHSIDLSGIENAADGVLKAFLWDGTDTIKPIAKTISPTLTSFEFTMPEGAYTSAGVYDMNDKLVRTLWSVVYYDEGTYTETWDGKDDQGVTVPDGNYRITVLSSNVEYDTFVDVIGNTSDCSSWDTYVGSYCSVFDMGYDPITERIYYCSNHVEGGYGLRYMTADNINRTEALMDGFYPNMTATRVAVDSERIYWGSEEMTMYSNEADNLSKAFIYATDEEANPYTFEHGEHVVSKWNDANNCIIYPSALNVNIINKWSEDGEFQYNRISGLEVQQNGDFLFSSYLDMNKVYVNNKNTGELLYTLEITAPGAISITGDNEDILYIAYKNENGDYKVASYSVAESGSLTKLAEMESVFDTVLGMAISPNGEKLVVIESGNKNRFQVFNTETEEILASFGSGESYLTDTLVKDDKLTFGDEVWSYPELYEHTFAEFLSDDEFLFGDSGNTRIYKMNISGETPQITDKNIFLGCNYNCQAVLNDETRITAGAIEYEVDYQKMDEYADNQDTYNFENAWSLKRNYREYLGTYYPEVAANSIEGIFMDPVILENGYTYFRMKHRDGNFYLYKEKDGIISRIDILMNEMDIMEDGSVYECLTDGDRDIFTKRDLLGFDENENPIWGEPYTVVSIIPGEHEPSDNPSYDQVAITDSDKFIILEAAGPGLDNLDAPGKNMHLGAVDISGGYGESYQWTASPRTLRRYDGPFPKDGYFAIKASQYTTRHPLTVGNNIIYCWHGNCFANIFYHFRDNGLAIGVYGREIREHGGNYDSNGAIEEVIPCNTFSLSVVQNPYDSDIAYIFQPSEGAAGGIFATRVSGLDSISEQSIEVKRKTALTSGIKYTLYDNDQINSAGIIKSGITNTFEIPYIAANDGKSVKFEGYIVPKETKTYRFAIETDGYVKFYIGNELAAKGTDSQAKKIDLEEGKMYAFTLEVMPYDGQLSYLRVGYEHAGKYYYLTEDMLLCKHPTFDDGNEVNLLEGFPYGETFESGIYGWDTAIYGGDGKSYLNISTNVWNYKHDADTDILMHACAAISSEERNEVILDRDLGEIASDTWQIDMDIRFWGYINRSNEAYGRAAIGTIIEVLDKDEKVIGNFYFGGGATYDETYRACVNNTEILRYPKVVTGSSVWSVEQISKLMDVPFNLPHTLKFTAQPNGTILAEYCGEVMEVNPVDETADWQSPAKVRFSRYNNWHGTAYSSCLNITRFNLIKEQ